MIAPLLKGTVREVVSRVTNNLETILVTQNFKALDLQKSPSYPVGVVK